MSKLTKAMENLLNEWILVMHEAFYILSGTLSSISKLLSFGFLQNDSKYKCNIGGPKIIPHYKNGYESILLSTDQSQFSIEIFLQWSQSVAINLGQICAYLTGVSHSTACRQVTLQLLQHTHSPPILKTHSKHKTIKNMIS